MLRFFSSFTITLLAAVIVVVAFFPPGHSDGGRATHVASSEASSTSSPGKLRTIELAHSFDLKAKSRTYEPPNNISQKFSFTDPQGHPRVWHGRAPGGFGPFPALILLHGSGRPGTSMIDMWRNTARQEGIVLIAPDAQNTNYWSMKDDGPDFLRALIKDAETQYRIDPKQIYIMGHSAGGVFVQLLAGQDSPPWQAMASHGAAFKDGKLRRSNRPVPLYLYTGSKDHLFPPGNMQRAATRLARAGHDVTRYDIPGHTHWYYEIGPQLAPLIWRDLTGK